VSQTHSAHSRQQVEDKARVPLPLTRRQSGQLLKLAQSCGTVYFIFKRILDVTLASVLLVLLLPLMAIVAILIKLDSAGPIFFAHERVGAKRQTEGGKTAWVITMFRCYKFRTMFQGSDQSLHKACSRDFVNGHTEKFVNGDGETRFKLVNDQRVTRLGRLLRKTSIDELPQLINVLKGEMSLVGPRPVPPYEVALYKSFHYGRLAALPGITGLWQVKGRARVTFEEMVRMDIELIRRSSFWLDIKILFLTIPAVFSRLGAE